MMQTSKSPRPGFTLIELITVMAIILILASMIVAVAYTANTKQIVANGSTTLVGWLKTAQAYALRDQRPYGLRLRPDGNLLCTTAQYIEQPADYVGPPGSTVSSTSTIGGSTAAITASAGIDFFGGWGSGANANWPVQPGDFFECNSGKIGQIATNGGNSLTVNLWEPDAPATATNGWNFTGMADWRIVRQPRTMVGADLLGLNNGVAINLNTNNTYSSPPPPNNGGNIDIVFAPTGNVITPGLTGRDIRLWLVDTTQPGFSASSTTFQGEQFIVTIAIRTGLISVQPVNVAPGGPGYANPYSFTQDGRSSGY